MVRFNAAPPSASAARIVDNAFRVLGLTPRATWPEVAHEADALLAALEAGDVTVSSYDTPLGPQTRTAAAVRVARARLRDPDVDVIVGLDAFEPKVPLERTEYVRADQNYSILARIVKATQVDTIVHTFLMVDSTRMSGRRLHEINVIGTMNLLAAAGLGAGDGVVLVLQALDEVGELVVALADLAVDLVLRAVGFRAQGVRDGGQDEPGGRGDGLQDGQGRVRVGGAGDVVRDVRGDAQHVVPGLHQPVLDQGLGAAGHLRLVEGAAVARDEVGAVAVRGEADRAGVRDAHRDAVEVHREADAEPLHDLLLVAEHGLDPEEAEGALILARVGGLPGSVVLIWSLLVGVPMRDRLESGCASRISSPAPIWSCTPPIWPTSSRSLMTRS